MNDEGAKRLIASILKQAHDDIVQTNACPEFCPMVDTCKNKVYDKDYCEAKRFIRSAWCATLCDGLNTEHQMYVDQLIRRNKLSKDIYRYIESELRNYKQSCRELEILKRDIILATPEKQEGHSTNISDPTCRAASLVMLDRSIKRYEKIVQAIKVIYDQCDEQKKKIIEMKYWQSRYRDEGIRYHIGISKTTFYRWKDAIILAIAVELGYL
jgi:RinA family phage transcriptional activator